MKTTLKPAVSFGLEIRPARRTPLTAPNEVMALEETGLEGDRYNKNGGVRKVTLVQAEHLASIASFLGRNVVDPQLTRRNIVVKEINLMALKGKKFKVGEAVLEYSGDCHPCSRMEENLGPGGYNAMRGLGGITARVVKSGKICVDDLIKPL